VQFVGRLQEYVAVFVSLEAKSARQPGYQCALCFRVAISPSEDDLFASSMQMCRATRREPCEGRKV
jgi:hypothetical protein